MKRPDFGGLLNVLGLAAIALALFVFLPSKCEAGNADVSWTHPTQYVDGTPLPLASILRTEIQWGKCNATQTAFDTGVVPITVNVAAPAAAQAIPAIPTGKYCFRARTVSTANELSDWTNLVWKDVTNVPGKPQNFTVTLSL